MPQVLAEVPLVEASLPEPSPRPQTTGMFPRAQVKSPDSKQPLLFFIYMLVKFVCPPSLDYRIVPKNLIFSSL